MFKIIQTKERNLIQLSIVPHLWEKESKLYWPVAGQVKRNEFDKLLKDGNSAPMSNWTLYPCRLKREKLTYEQAVHESKVMSDQSDTDQNENLQPTKEILPEKRKGNRVTQNLPKVFNFSNMVSTLY